MKQPAEPELVKNYLLKTLQPEKRIDNFTLGEGVMPTSFKDSHRQKDILVADFGGSAIGRVAPFDSGFWWIILLRCARQMLKPERDGKELIERIDKRITALSYHIQKDYWLNFTQLNNIYRYKNGGLAISFPGMANIEISSLCGSVKGLSHKLNFFSSIAPSGGDFPFSYV
ncbi:hypothetical protein DKX38_030071 (mitochondrion) [Salix brachista]|uniref:Uncharacterized protein n=1 Tax=Salix brachista TaxID=2182728 RepID=A0A5N5IXX3_9ROSI|nr:hypothetical protein DKX38_030071 [Salix brachista]